MQVDRHAVKIVSSAMTKWIILGAIVAVLWIAWRWLPVGKVHGRKITPSDLTDSNVKLQLQMSRAESAVSECNKLPPRDRLPKLLETEKRFGDVFIAGDHIRQAIMATGVGEAVPHFRRILNGHHGAGSVIQGISGALAGHIEDDYRVQTFKFLVDGLKGKDMFGSSSERIPGLLLELDEAWAAPILREICEREPDHYLFLQIFAELDARGLPVDPAVAEKMLSGNESAPLPGDEATRQIVAAKSLHGEDSVRAEGILEQIMKSQPEVAGDAAEALLEIRDLPHPRFLLDDLQNEKGFDVLSDAEKAVWLVDRCGYYLGMDYLYRFDEEVEGDRLQEMQHALARVGATKTAAKLEAYMELYGPDGPPSTVAEREKIAEAKGEEWGQSVSALKEIHNSWEDVTALAMQYELRHAEQFHKASEIRKILDRPERPSLFNR